MLFEGSVEGPQRIEARIFADVDDGIVRFPQKTGCIGYAQRIDIIVEADIQLISEEMRYIVL